MKLISTNNFDLIRLFAASQVAISHSAWHLGYQNFIIKILNFFPGVPIFFFISGFLIYGSFEKSSEHPNPIKNFLWKRILRLYPALLTCLILSIISIWYTGYFDSYEVDPISFLSWFFAQATFFQFYNGEFLRSYGVGVINGSLWTISVEIQFYLLTPLLFFIVNRSNKYTISTILILFLLANIMNSQLNSHSLIAEKLISVSFIPWLYMFLLGALLYRYRIMIFYIKRIHFSIILALFIITYFASSQFGWGNAINPVGYLSLILLIVKCAFTLPELSNKILKRNDFSYGIYIVHMPVVNYLLNANIVGDLGFFCCLTLTIGFAIISWFLIERPCLKMKSFALRSL